jgi:excinuclease UvrABC nuclease subunit
LALPEKRWPFTRANLEYAPDEPGIFVLWDGDEVIYVGRATRGTIKSELLAHQDGANGACTMKATHYSWEITLLARAREAALLEEFHAQFQRAPRCNGKPQ